MDSPIERSILEVFSSPRGVVVVGASSNKSKIGFAVLQNITKYKKKGGATFAIVAVNNKSSEETILGVPVFQDISNIPLGMCDLAVVVTPASSLIGIVEACGCKGIKGAIVISAGFKEMGPEGQRLESDLMEAAKKNNVRILGPNTIGIMDTKSSFNASFAVGMPRLGQIAFLSQSGALCTAILDMSERAGLGFCHFVSLGNKADIDEVDFLQEWSEDSESTVLAGYIEGVNDGIKFMNVVKKVTKKKPVILLKAGTTKGGIRAACSHTGTLAGSEKAYDAAFKQCGVIRVRSLQDLLGIAGSFAKQPLPANGSVAVVTNAGGCGILAADAIGLSASLKLATFSPHARLCLEKVLPAAASKSNPVDVLGDARADRYMDAMEAVLSDECVGSLLVILTPQAPTQAADTAELVGIMGRKYGKPCFASFMGDSLVMEAKKCLEGHCIPNFEEPGKAVVAMDAMVAHRQWRDEPLEEGSFLGSIDKLMAEEVLTRIRQTGEHATGGFEARGILQAYGIPMPKSELAETAIEAQDAASKIGYPAVLKIASPQILHKSTIGGVALNLKTPEQVGDAFELMMHRAAQKRPDASIRGCQVLPMIKGGREVIIGISLDEQFNHLVMFGLGGTMVEGMKDVTFRIAPINRKDCADMISEIRGTNFLQREPGIDVDAIVDVLLRVSKLALDFPEIQELDINPLVVYPPSQGALSLDMRISLI